MLPNTSSSCDGDGVISVTAAGTVEGTISEGINTVGARAVDLRPGHILN